MSVDIPIVGGAYTGRSSNVAPETCINWFLEKGKNSESLVSVSGSIVFNSTYSGQVRGGIEYNSLAYFVIGNKLVEFSASGSSTVRGTLNTSGGRVWMAHNGVRTGAVQQLMITDGTTGYLYDNPTQVMTEIADIDMVSADTVVFIDGYFVFSQSNSDRLWNSAAYDGTTITGTDFYTAEGDPDVIQALVADQREIFVFGKKTTEVWYNAGEVDSLFQRFQGGYSQVGCVAPATAVRCDNSVMWLSEDEHGHGQVVRFAQGYQPVYVSSPELDYQISTYTTISNAFAYVYQAEGHEFYVLTFPDEKATWVFDARTSEWHRRGHTIGGVFPNKERYSCHVFAFGKHLLGDFQNGRIYELNPSVGTIDGVAIPKERTTGYFADNENRVRLTSAQLDMEEGTSSTIWLSYSKDGGHTFSNERDRSTGTKFNHRVIWRQLGQARGWIFRIRTWDTSSTVLKRLLVREYGAP